MTHSKQAPSRLRPSVVSVIISAGLILASHGALSQPFANVAAAKVDYSKGQVKPAQTCADMAQLTLPGVVNITAQVIPAEGAVPEHCRVNGVIDPEIVFQVNLPAHWNTRFYMVGNGGHAGQSPDDPFQIGNRNAALQHNFVMAATNTGHDTAKEPGASFVLSNPQKAIDYAYRAVHLTAVTAKEIANQYYGHAVAYSYWNSCSNGGRQGMLEAQRYPNDFDGILAVAPWVDQTGFTIGALWNHRALNDEALAQQPVTGAKMMLVAENVMAKCDNVDGVKDGIIDDPRRCNFDVAKDAPSCAAGNNDETCLTAAQATAIQKIYDGPRDSSGKQIFSGFELGSEAVTQGFGGTSSSGWMNLIVPNAPGGNSADFGLAQDTMRYLVFQPPQPDYDYKNFDFDRDVELLDRWSRLADAKDSDLSAFRASGGKIIMTYGWADSILQPMMGVNYYEKAAAANEDVEDFFRLFMVPGMSHCAGGVGPDQMDAVSAIIDWVEKDKQPDTLIAKKIVGGETVRERPLCPYPQVAKYKGRGSIDEAKNFRCRAPK